MGILRRIHAAVLLLILCTTVLVLPAAANTMVFESDQLEVTIEMDKEVYDAGEPITATLTIKNISSDAITIQKAEGLVPEGYQLSSESKEALTNLELRAGSSAVLKVVFETEPEAEDAQQEDIWHKLLYGETLGIPNLLIAVILVIAFAIFMFLT